MDFRIMSHYLNDGCGFSIFYYTFSIFNLLSHIRNHHYVKYMIVDTDFHNKSFDPFKYSSSRTLPRTHITIMSLIHQSGLITVYSRFDCREELFIHTIQYQLVCHSVEGIIGNTATSMYILIRLYGNILIQQTLRNQGYRGITMLLLQLV